VSAALRLGLVAFLGWLYGGDLVRALGLGSAEVAALVEPPNTLLAVLGLGLALVGATATALELAGRPLARRPPWRLWPVAAAALLAVDLALLSSGRPALSVEDRARGAVALVADAARERLDGARPLEAAALEQALAPLGQAPYFVRGERARWRVELRTGCQGPALEPRGQPPGTVLYCAAQQGGRAWVTVVALEPGQAFGAPRVPGGEGWVEVVEGPGQR
jgi:hypothetical protein